MTLLRDNEKLQQSILKRLREGQTLIQACREVSKKPQSLAVLCRILAAENSDFSERYARARRIGFETLADELIEITDTPHYMSKTTTKYVDNEIVSSETLTYDAVEHRRLQVDTRKWFLAKMLPKIYGPKIEAEIDTEEVRIIGGLEKQ